MLLYNSEHVTSKTGNGIATGPVMPLGIQIQKDKSSFALFAIVAWRLSSELGFVDIRMQTRTLNIENNPGRCQRPLCADAQLAHAVVSLTLFGSFIQLGEFNQAKLKLSLKKVLQKKRMDAGSEGDFLDVSPPLASLPLPPTRIIAGICSPKMYQSDPKVSIPFQDEMTRIHNHGFAVGLNPQLLIKYFFGHFSKCSQSAKQMVHKRE